MMGGGVHVPLWGVRLVHDGGWCTHVSLWGVRLVHDGVVVYIYLCGRYD